MKKLIILVFGCFLVLGLALTVFAEGQQEDAGAEDSDKTVITILARSHFVPQFDPEFQYQCDLWSEQHPNVDVRVDFVSYADLPIKYASESEARQGHDIIVFEYQSVILYGNSLANVDDIAEQLDAKYGGWVTGAKDAVFVDGHWRAIPWYTAHEMYVYRTDFFQQAGYSKQQVRSDDFSLNDLLAASKKLDAIGHPGGLAISATPDSNEALYAILWEFDASTVDENGNVAIDSPETRAAIDYVQQLYEVMDSEVLAWDSASNNRHILSGKGSWTPNTPSIYAVALKDLPDIARHIDHAPIPKGPTGKRYRMLMPFSLGIWEFSENKELAKDLVRFLLEKEQVNRQITESNGYNTHLLNNLRDHPYWSQVEPLNMYVPGKGRYALPGYPGPAGTGATKVENNFVLPIMFAKIINGMPVDEAIAWAEGEIVRLYAE